MEDVAELDASLAHSGCVNNRHQLRREVKEKAEEEENVAVLHGMVCMYVWHGIVLLCVPGLRQYTCSERGRLAGCECAS